MYLKFFDVQYVLLKQKPFIFFFCRDKNRKRVTVKVPYRPYFYVSDKNVMLLPVEEARKVYVDIPSEVASERIKYDYTYESDIDFCLRFIIDRGLKNCMFELRKGEIVPTDKIINVPPRVWILDIEKAYSETIDPFIADQPIVCMTVYDTYEQREITYLGPEGRILQKFLRDITEMDPDVIAGWNISFDVIYIIRRLQKLGLDWQSLSPIGVVQCRKEQVKIHGRQLIDLREVYVKYKHKKFESENLTYIAVVEEGIANAPLETDYKWYSEHPKEFLELNRSHVRYCKEINEKYNLIGLREALRMFICGRYRETEFISRALDLLLLRRYHGIYVARKRLDSAQRKKYKGAFVLQPTAGIYKNVIVLDYSAMYPSIIRAYNISPETLTDNPENAFELNETYFKREPRGVLPTLIEELLSMRAEVRKRMRTETRNWRDLYALQYAYKQIIASIYGTFASPYFRFYAPEISAAITFAGRNIIKNTIKMVESQGYKVVESDTDSTLVALGDVEDPVQKANELNDYINAELKRKAEEEGSVPLTIKFEKVYSTLIATSRKKRYAGLVTWDEGHKTRRLEVKGLEYKRSNSPQITKEIQEKILMMLLEGKKEEVHDYLLDIEEQIKQYPLEKLAIPVKLQKRFEDYSENYQASLKGIKWTEMQTNKQFELNERIYLIYVKKPFPRIKLNNKIYEVDRVAFSKDIPLPDNVQVDYKQIVEKIVNKKVKSILEAAGLLVDARQAKLDRWFA